MFSFSLILANFGTATLLFPNPGGWVTYSLTEVSEFLATNPRGVLTLDFSSGRFSSGQATIPIQIYTVPEPSTIALSTLGALALGFGIMCRTNRAVERMSN